MGLIFFLSAQNAEISSETSSQVIETLAEKFYPEYSEMTDAQREELISSLQFAVRKTAHICMFAVLGFFAFLTFVSYTRLRFFTRTFWAAFISILYAASDEFHQYFVVGRSCELRDFFIDTSGIVAAILLCTLFVKIIGPLRRKTAFAGVYKNEWNTLKLEPYEKFDQDQYQNFKFENELRWQEVVEEPKKATFEEPLIIIEEQQKPQERTETPQEIEEKEKCAIKLDCEMEYAAKVIGECVIEVTKVCNKITLCEKGENQKELVNLALGRTEVLKSQILNILKTDKPFSEKMDLIGKEKQQIYDYFDSILAQMC
ncbi:MAG: VanZ family protein [Clostridia bacterium]|nr:VanZ family protein [Clostridia bacterium]